MENFRGKQYCKFVRYIITECQFCVSQIYVEVERARLTLDLAKIKEEQGDIAGAATILQDLQV